MNHYPLIDQLDEPTVCADLYVEEDFRTAGRGRSFLLRPYRKIRRIRFRRGNEERELYEKAVKRALANLTPAAVR